MPWAILSSSSHPKLFQCVPRGDPMAVMMGEDAHSMHSRLAILIPSTTLSTTGVYTMMNSGLDTVKAFAISPGFN